MAKTFLVTLVLILVGIFLYFNSSSTDQNSKPTSLPGATGKKTPNQIDISHNDNNYRLNWAVISVPKNIVIGTNLEEKKTAKSIYDENKCQALINGGFYTENDDYIGLVYIAGKKVSNESKDPFFSGVFYITKLGEAGIGLGVPIDPLNYAVQSGPILARYRAYQRLGIEDDEYKRRMVLAMTDREEALFITVYDPVSGYLGPKLGDVPEILKKFAREKEISIVDAMNLDGGSASAFYTEGVALGEITHIGSYLCAR